MNDYRGSNPDIHEKFYSYILTKFNLIIEVVSNSEHSEGFIIHFIFFWKLFG